jgi:anti-sigma B factor antagonist
LSQTEEERGESMDLMLNEYSAAPGQTVIEVSGEIDVYTAPRLRETLVSLVDAGNSRLIVDMEGVEFLDSTGLGVLVGGLKRVRAIDGGIDLVCTQGRILRIFRITGLSKVFSIFGSVDEALASHECSGIHLAPTPGPGAPESASEGSRASVTESGEAPAPSDAGE